jgi:hypothetical protein
MVPRKPDSSHYIEGNKKMNILPKSTGNETSKKVYQMQSPTLLCTDTVGKNHLLRSFYEKHQGATTVSKIVISMVNSILSHRLIFFAVTDNQILNIAKNDVNWKLNSRFKVHEARTAIEDMIRMGMIERFVSGDESKATLYAVCCPDLLNEIDPLEPEIKLNQAMVLNWLNQNYK